MGLIPAIHSNGPLPQIFWMDYGHSWYSINKYGQVGWTTDRHVVCHQNGFVIHNMDGSDGSIYISYFSHTTLSSLYNHHQLNSPQKIARWVLYHIFLKWHFLDYIITITVEFSSKNDARWRPYHIFLTAPRVHQDSIRSPHRVYSHPPVLDTAPVSGTEAKTASILLLW